jgi:DNA helicase-2/ATP-dependent DNA helicase PcrA
MSDVIPLDEIEPTGIDEYPETASVKLHGPPGTGKTTQSAARVGRLVRDHGYDVGDIAWCTYRRSLAFDTLERFVQWGLLDESQMNDPHRGATRFISTIHAVANRAVGSLPDPVQIGHKVDFCSRMDIPFMTDDPWDDSAGKLLFQTFEWMNNNLLDPADPSDVRLCPVADDLRNKWNGDVPATYNRWEDYKAQKDIIDFHEMLSAPLKENVVPTEDIVVIDEYHDATPLMAKLCEYWIQNADISIVAGDPNQVVNGFDGANPRFFEELELPKVLLDKTYRVPEEHWRAATRVLGKAHDIPGVEREGNGRVTEYRSPVFEHSDENGWQVPSRNSAASPASIVEEHGTDTLFLTRMQMQADGIGAALEHAGILYTSQADLHGWNTENGESRMALFNALQKLRGMQPGHLGRGSGLAQFGDAPRPPDGTTLSTREATALLNHVHAKHLDQSRSDTDDIVDDIRERELTPTLTELDDWVTTDFWTKHSQGPASVSRLNKGKLDDRDRRALQAALKRYGEPVDPDDIDVACLTIHASKGQEAEDVVVYDGVSRRIQREMRTDNAARKNEFRTWYVALTRASDHLHIMRNAFQWTSPILPQNIRQIAGGGASA